MLQSNKTKGECKKRDEERRSEEMGFTDYRAAWPRTSGEAASSHHLTQARWLVTFSTRTRTDPAVVKGPKEWLEEAPRPRPAHQAYRRTIWRPRTAQACHRRSHWE